MKRGRQTHSDAEGFEDVGLAHGTGAMVQQPRIHTALMEQMSAEERNTVRSAILLPICVNVRKMLQEIQVYICFQSEKLHEDREKHVSAFYLMKLI